MYNDRERLMHHRQLLSPADAAADLALLRQLSPRHARLAEFALSPQRSAGSILMELLALASRDQIVMNRMRHSSATAAATADAAPKADTIDMKPKKKSDKPKAKTSDVNPQPSKKKGKKKSTRT